MRMTKTHSFFSLLYVALISVLFFYCVKYGLVRKLLLCESEKETLCLFLNPHTRSHIEKIVNARNLRLESYQSITEDGYILTTFRIPPKANSKGAVFLQHPLTASSLFWVAKGNHSLAFALHDAGFDVWLANGRDTPLSNTAVNLTSDDYEYWNFSWHEMGFYDLKSQLDLAHNITGKKLFFIGYSLGTTESFVFASERPEEAKKYVEMFIAFSPSAVISHATGFLRFIIDWKISNLILFTSRTFKTGTVPDTLLLTATNLFCANPYSPFKNNFCMFVFNTLCGWDSKAFDTEAYFDILFANYPTSLGVKVLNHFAQLMQSENAFRKYDYGEKLNLVYYNSSIPPEYKAENINVPIHFIHASRDCITNSQDLEEFMSRLPDKVKIFEKKELVDYNHCDIFVSKSVKEEINGYIIKFIDSFLGAQ